MDNPASNIRPQHVEYVRLLKPSKIFLCLFQQTIDALKTTCSMLEGQIEELEILNDELDERNVQLEIEK